MTHKSGNHNGIIGSGGTIGSGGGMLTVSQVADSLNVHPHSVRRWADLGLLHCYRLGYRGDRRFKQEDVDTFLGTHVKRSG